MRGAGLDSVSDQAGQAGNRRLSRGNAPCAVAAAVRLDSSYCPLLLLLIAAVQRPVR